jgi:endonuclease/exonuclease/phosphatase family metal-dependent hydrolase
MTTPRLKTAARALATLLALAVLVSPALAAPGSTAATQDPKFRKVTPPNVFYPVTGSRAVKDRKNFSRSHRGTDINTRCGATAFATHPGTARVVTNSRWIGKYTVRVVSNAGGLVTTSAYLSQPYVTNGQTIQSGQPIGKVSRKTRKSACGIYFAVRNGTTVRNPSSWLSSYVGKTPPVGRLFGNTGFNVASFNVLGASHTKASARFATFAPRMARTVNLINQRRLDVVGLQEFQDAQKAEFLKRTGDTFGMYHQPGPRGGDTDNALIWRNSTMEFVEAHTFKVPYFEGNLRSMPAVLLKDKATGRTAWFMNVHNPANTHGSAQHWRDKAVAIEKRKMIELRAAGRPVFLTGDFNDRSEAFCPLTANRLSISPNSIPSYKCALPRQFSIDWIFAAGQTRFSSFIRDTYTQTARISDHPIVITRAHIED